MKSFTINLDEATADFFEALSSFSQKPVEEIISDALFKQVELLLRKITETEV